MRSTIYIVLYNTLHKWLIQLHEACVKKHAFSSRAHNEPGAGVMATRPKPDIDEPFKFLTSLEISREDEFKSPTNLENSFKIPFTPHIDPLSSESMSLSSVPKNPDTAGFAPHGGCM